jgi:hypothetical protein
MIPLDPLPAARVQGWESRLIAVIEAAREREYALGVHDCFSFTCAVVHALTGVDRWPLFGGYTSKRESLARIAQYGSTFEKAYDYFFGATARLPSPLFAQRGDILAIQTTDGVKHLGVCGGPYVLLLSDHGMASTPLDHARVQAGFYTAAWKVGRA